MSIFIFIVVLLLLVLAHEFGHFIIAKKAGIRVDEFAFGFGPKIWSMKRGETDYVLNAFPAGGYVKIYGENPNDVSQTDRSRSFTAQPRFVQGLVIVAGIVFNLLLAWFLFSAAFMIGVPAPGSTSSPQGSGGDGHMIKNPQLTITGTGKDSPAAFAGLTSGDVLKKLSDGAVTETVANSDDVIAFISPREGQLITLTYERGGEERTASVIPVGGIVSDAAAIGVYMDIIGTLRLPPHIAIWEGLKKTYQFTELTVVGIANFLYDTILGRSNFDEVAGPVGIVRQVGDAAGFGFANLLLFTAIISINLAVINIIPFPALDGGRLLFIVIEGIMRRPIKPVVANIMNAVGFALLMLLMVAVTYSDITKLVQ